MVKSNVTSNIDSQGPLAIIEEAIHLLRQSPFSVLACYYIGALPFVLGLLYFWTDMSQSAFARDHIAQSTLGISILFLWMKSWQTVFCRYLRAQRVTEPPWRWQRIFRLVCIQTMLQPYGLFLLPIAFLMTLPFPWVYAFYQNVTVLGHGESLSWSAVFEASWRQSMRLPKQNLLILSILGFWGVFVTLNLSFTLFFLPHLLHTLLGIQTPFTLGGVSVFNSTFFASLFSLVYLCIDPVVKAVYTLRCFYGDARINGSDLKAELQSWIAQNRSLGIALIFFVLLTTPLEAQNRVPNDVSSEHNGHKKESAPGVSASELNQHIQNVLKHRKYEWRLPKDTTGKTEKKGPLSGFIEDALKIIQDWLTPLWKGIKIIFQKILDWLDRLFETDHPMTQQNQTAKNSLFSKQILLFILLAIVASISGVLLWRWRNQKRQPSQIVNGVPAQARVDLNDEQIAADQFPLDRWQAIAQEYLDKGEFRLALRAMFLATLAYLADHQRIRIERHKSNRDYLKELRRREQNDTVLDAFEKNTLIFEHVWYGLHDVSEQLMNQFNSNQRNILV